MSILTGSKKQTRERKKKPDELLASVIRETAVPAAVEVLRTNEPFAFPSGTAWVILMLEAEAIGGLSKRHSRDEAKGSLIELIDSDQIQTLATADMLREEVFGIIPTASTLERMEEYSLLTGADYTWAVVYQDASQGLRVDQVARATFNQARAIGSGEDSLRDAVGDEAWAAHSGEVVEKPAATEDSAEEVSADDEQAPEGEADQADPLFEDVPDFEGVDGDEPVFSEEPDEDLLFDGELENTDPTVVAGAAEPSSDGGDLFAGEDEDADETDFESDEYGYDDDYDYDETAEPVADQEQVRSTIARRFLSEDLDLEVSLEEFEVSFNVGAPVVQIAVPEDASAWLGDQIAQLTRQANAELYQLHEAHETDLQAQYVNLMSMHAEQVIRDVSTERDGSIYKALKETAQREHAEREAKKDDEIRIAKEKIRESYDEQARRVGEQAALQAELQYKERNKTRVQREQLEVAAEVTQKIEDQYSHAQQQILGVRRKDAQLKMSTGQTRVFEIIAEQRRKYFAEETKLLQQWTEQIQRLIDENRKSDITRAQALAEEQARFDQVAALEKEHADALERIEIEHRNRVSRLQEEFDQTREQAVLQMKARDEEWQHALNLEKEKTASQEKRASDLLAQMERQGDVYKKQYEERVNELEADRNRHSHDLEQQNQLAARSNKILTVLMVALPLLFGVAGVVVGSTL